MADDVKPPGILQVRIVWAALLGSQALYLYLLVSGVFETPPEPPAPIMLTVVSAVAMVNGMASIFLPRFLLGQALGRMSEHDRALVQQGRDAILRRAFTMGFPAYIIGIALAEAVAIFGLVLGVMGFTLMTVLPFFAAGAVLTLTKFPTEGRFLAPLEEALSRRS